MRERLSWLKGLVGHSEQGHSSVSACYCSGARLAEAVGGSEKHSLASTLAELAAIIHEGISKPGYEPAQVGRKGKATFEHLGYGEFSQLRSVFGMREEEYEESLSDMSGGATKESGRSGSLFWFSGDGRYLVKSVSRREADKLLEILPDYVDHVSSALIAKRTCLLSKFFGLYRLSIGKESLHLLVLNDVFIADRPDQVYNLKGTTQDRYVEPAPNTVLKDFNFDGQRLCLGAQGDAIVAALFADTGLLRAHGIVDYSLLLGVYHEDEDVHGRRLDALVSGHLESRGKADASGDRGRRERRRVQVRVGLIDVLADCRSNRRTAFWLKQPSLACCQEEVGEPPEHYQDRFLEFLETKLMSSLSI